MTVHGPVLDGQIAITPADAQQHGLRPVGLRLDARGTGLIVSAFNAPGVYVSVSGAPGSMLFFQVVACARVLSDRGEIVPVLLERARALELQPCTTFGVTPISGAPRGVAVISGTGVARDSSSRADLARWWHL